MPRGYAKFLFVLVWVSSSQCFADVINLGFIKFDEGSSTAAFAISNNTAANASPFPDASFPVVTPVSFANLTLFVNFADGTAQQFDSYNGQAEPDFATKPISSAILTGTFGASDLLLNNGTAVTIDPSLFAIITAAGPSGVITPSDFGLIQATTTLPSQVPEPSMVILGACGLAAIVLRRALL